MFNNFYITNKGASLLAKAQTGTVLNFTKAEIGKGDVPAGTDIVNLTALVSKVKNAVLVGLTTSPQQAQVKIQVTNEGVSTQFLWKEIGLYAMDPDEGEILYAYGNAGVDADTIPAAATSPVEFLFNMILKITNTTQVTVTIDNSLIYATQDDFNYLSGCMSALEMGLFSLDEQKAPTTKARITSGSGSAYTVNINGIMELYEGLIITIKPHTVNTVSEPTLNVNNLGAYSIRRTRSCDTNLGLMPAGNWLQGSNGDCVTLKFANYQGSSYWVVMDMVQPVWSDVLGAPPKTEAVLTSGSGSAYTVTIQGVTQLAQGLLICITPHTTNTGVNPTLNVNSLGNVYIKRVKSSGVYEDTITAGLLKANRSYLLKYTDTYWVLVELPKPDPDWGDVAYKPTTLMHTNTDQTMGAKLVAGGAQSGTVGQVRNSVILPFGTTDFTGIPANTIIYILGE